MMHSDYGCELDDRFLEVVPRIKVATVLVGLPPEQIDDSTPGSGTGFVVSRDGRVVTNRHVVEPYLATNMAKWLRVWFPAYPKPRPYRVADHLFDPVHDLCLLRLYDDGPVPEPLPIAWDYQVREGESVALCGYPYGFTNMFHRGKAGLRGVNSVVQRALISALWPHSTAHHSELTSMQLDALTNPGNSGGPVFLPTTGAVIGVVTSFLQNNRGGQRLHTGISEALPACCLHTLFQRGNP
jgi:serine protease Do